MIICIEAFKGGVGKSTIAQNLAVCFVHMEYNVVLVDTDRNGVTTRWGGIRKTKEVPQIKTINLFEEKNLIDKIESLHDNSDILIIDGMPGFSELLSSILLISDILLIPQKPMIADLWSTEEFLTEYNLPEEEKDSLIKKVRTSNKSHIVITQLVKNVNWYKQCIENIESFGMPILKERITFRYFYDKVKALGLGVYESEESPQAKKEIISIANEIIEIIEKENTKT